MQLDETSGGREANRPRGLQNVNAPDRFSDWLAGGLSLAHRT
jgi:hypothetical protein